MSTRLSPIKILALDGGTPEGVITQISLVKEILNRSAYDAGKDVDPEDLRPSDYFDIIGGTGLGGTLALLFGHRKLTCKESREEMGVLLKTVFVEPEEATSQSTLQWFSSTIMGYSSGSSVAGEKLNDKGLEKAMKEMFDVPVDVVADGDNGGCIAAVFVRSTFNLADCRAVTVQNGNVLTLECTVAQAACATVSIPDLFPPIEFVDKRSYISAGLGSINPTRELIKVAESVYTGDRRVACIINIGSGTRRAVRHRIANINGAKGGEDSAVDDIARSIEDHIAVDALRTSEELKRRLTNASYFYLSVDNGLHDAKMTGWDLSQAETHADSYKGRADADAMIDTCVMELAKDTGGITLRQLVQSTATGPNAKSFMKPPHHFVEPIAEYNQIYKALIRQEQPIVVVTGRLGIGKSLLSSYFAYREQKRYKHIFLIDSKTEGDIRGDLQIAIRSLGPEYRHASWEQAIGFFTTTKDPWLIIFDGVGEDVRTPSFLPHNKHGVGKTIINGRDKMLGALAPGSPPELVTNITMGPRSDRDAMKILEKTAHHDTLLGDSATQAFRLCKAVGCLPIVLVQAGTYCRRMSSYEEGSRQNFNFESYTKMYEMGKQRWELLGEKAPSGMDGYNQYFMQTLEADINRKR